MNRVSNKALAGWSAGLLIFCLVLCLVLGLILDRVFPVPLGQPLATVVTSRDNIPLRAFADTQGIWRYPARPDQVSPLYLEALLAYEDRWFYRHPGINPLAMVRALIQNLRHGRVISGGSTLTMQVARILDPNYRSIAGKFKQMFRALQLEFHLTKDEILGLYLTHAPFGANIEGVRTAAYTWLGKDAMELTHAEAALLAVLPQAPSRLRPDRHPDRAVKARDKVLDRLTDFGVWSPQDVAGAKKEPVISLRFPHPMIAPLAARRLRSQALKINSKTPGESHQALIPTLLDYEFQIHVADLLKNYMGSLPPRQSGAVLVVNHKTLAVKAYAGSGDFTNSKRKGHVDMIQALRSPGSALKPFAYGMAIDEGLIHSHSLLLDTPRFGEPYDPGNFAGGFAGPVSAAQALRDSLNLPAVQVLEAYGPARFHDRLKHSGARLSMAGKPNLSMVLGGMGTNLESLVTLYTALGRGGLTGRPRLRPSDPVQERYLMSPGAAYIIRKLLSRPLPGQEGIARLSGARVPAWKTGTSYGFRDAWALGIQGDFVVGVWVGRPDGSPSPGQYGAVTAVPLMAQVLESLEPGSGQMALPSSVIRETICWPSGLAESQMKISLKNQTHGSENSSIPGACARRHKAWILNHQIPPTLVKATGLSAPLVQTFWIDKAGRRATPLCGGIQKSSIALWPWQAEPFILPQWRRARMLPQNSDQCPDLAPMAAPRIRIVSVSNGSILTRQPGNQGKIMVPLKALGGTGQVYWFLNRKVLEEKSGVAPLAMTMPDPGKYQLAVVDETGNSDQVSFQVIEH